MALEIEVKYHVRDAGALRERLLRAGAERGELWLERSAIFDTPERRLLNADSALRLRERMPLGGRRSEEVPTTCLIAYKGPRRNSGGVKGREEIEFSVGDLTAATALLGRLGFRRTVYYERRRESWQFETCEVCVDELPDGVTYVEIEGDCDTKVLAVAKHLELADGDRDETTYVEYAARVGADDGAGCAALRF